MPPRLAVRADVEATSVKPKAQQFAGDAEKSPGGKLTDCGQQSTGCLHRQEAKALSGLLENAKKLIEDLKKDRQGDEARIMELEYLLKLRENKIENHHQVLFDLEQKKIRAEEKYETLVLDFNRVESEAQRREKALKREIDDLIEEKKLAETNADELADMVRNQEDIIGDKDVFIAKKLSELTHCSKTINRYSRLYNKVRAKENVPQVRAEPKDSHSKELDTMVTFLMGELKRSDKYLEFQLYHNSKQDAQNKFLYNELQARVDPDTLAGFRSDLEKIGGKRDSTYESKKRVKRIEELHRLFENNSAHWEKRMSDFFRWKHVKGNSAPVDNADNGAEGPKRPVGRPRSVNKELSGDPGSSSSSKGASNARAAKIVVAKANVGAKRVAEGAAKANVGAKRAAEAAVKANVGAKRAAEAAVKANVGAKIAAEAAVKAKIGAQRAAEGAVKASVGAQRAAEGPAKANVGAKRAAQHAGNNGNAKRQRVV